MARILGIDIDRSALRGTMLKTAFRRTEVERYLQIPLTEAPESPGRIPEVREALENLIRALGKPPDATVTSIDGTHASVRVVELPVAAGKRIAEVLPFELESVLPFEISDAVIDHQPIETVNGQLRMLAAATLKQRVREHLAVFAGTHADPREVAVGAAALDGLRFMCPEVAIGSRALLEICEREANICVLKNGRACFSRTISMEATASKKSDEEFWQAVHRTFAAYRAGGGDPVEVLYLCGNGPLSQISPWLSGELSIPVEVLKLPASTGAMPNDTNRFARSLALAARASAPQKRINMRMGEFTATRGKTELASQLNLMALCAVVVLLTLIFSLKAQQSVLTDEQAALKSQLAATTENIFGKAEQNPVAVEAMLASPPSDNPLPRFDAYDALAAISDSVPQEITHELRHVRIDLADEKKEGQLELQGGLASIDQRDQIVAKLEAHGCFVDIQRGRTSTGRTPDQISYQIESKVSCPGDSPKSKKRTTRGSDE